MPKKSDEMMALADVYAEGLLEAATERQAAEGLYGEFQDLIRFMDAEPEFDKFLTAESVDDDPRRDSLEKLFRGKMQDLLLNLLQVLNNRGRTDLVRLVFRAVQLRMEARHHQQEVVVETAMPLSDETKTMLKERLSTYIGKEALLMEEVVPELIGGVVIHIEDEQIDASVASHVRRLSNRFHERAVVEIHDEKSYEL